MKIAVLMACYNRREKTLSCLRLLGIAAEFAGADATVYLCDDGSSDCTAEAVAAEFPTVVVVRGGGLYWAAGMRVAENEYRASQPSADYLLWLNDDVELDAAAIAVMLTTAATIPNTIVVGATRSRDSGVITYSGLMRSGLHPLNFSRVEPTDHPKRIDTFNGNVVLVPNSVAELVGGIDGTFSHAFADIDYGLRAAMSGVESYLHTESVGICEANPTTPDASVVEAWREFIGVKGGGNSKSTRHYLKRHSTRYWYFYYLSTYILWWVRHISRGVHSILSRKLAGRTR